MNVLAIIPARGGSKGIPRKNLRPIGGIPLIAHTIRHALATSAITRTVVSTDDPEIAEVSRAWGAEVIVRPPELSGDTASSESALLHVLDSLRDAEGWEPDLVVFLQATSPLRRTDDIANAIATLQRENADSLFSSTRVEGFVWRLAPDGVPSALSFDFHNRPRRQDAPEDVIENGSIYVFRPRVLRELGNRLGGRITTYRMSPLDSPQVDEPPDLEVIARLYASRDHGQDGPDLSAVELLVLDFDGVLTDNRVWVDQDGRESVACHRGDGWGIGKLRRAGVEVLILSTEQNPVVSARARKLQVGCVQGCDDKGSALRDIIAERGLSPEQVAFVGNDENDLGCLEMAGVPIAVADATLPARVKARYITRTPGGAGAVREVAEWILRGRSSTPAQRTRESTPPAGSHSRSKRS